jgi:hypothetical protein
MLFARSSRGDDIPSPPLSNWPIYGWKSRSIREYVAAWSSFFDILAGRATRLRDQHAAAPHRACGTIVLWLLSCDVGSIRCDIGDGRRAKMLRQCSNLFHRRTTLHAKIS